MDVYKHHFCISCFLCLIIFIQVSFLSLKSLAELEALCTHLYVGTDLNERIEAEKALLELIDSPECLSKCQLLLEQGTVSMRCVADGTGQC